LRPLSAGGAIWRMVLNKCRAWRARVFLIGLPAGFATDADVAAAPDGNGNVLVTCDVTRPWGAQSLG